jgi:MFS family permease
MCQSTSAKVDTHSATSSGGSSPENVAADARPTVVDKMNSPLDVAQENLRRGILYGSLALALLILSFSLVMPHLQSRRDALQCDSLCYGSLTSARSFLEIVGGAFVGKLSDYKGGRIPCLYLGTFAALVGLVIGASNFSIQGLWLAMIPGALLQQNFSVLKALLADYHEAVSQTFGKDDASARAGSVGKLGMSVGLAFMVGPLLGSTVVETFEQATALAILAIVGSATFISLLPTPPTTNMNMTIAQPGIKSSKVSWWSMLDVKAARKPPAIFLMVVRVLMALAFHIFNTIWQVSLKARFDFGPLDHGKFYSFIGLAYALSQGFVANKLMSYMVVSGNSKDSSNSKRHDVGRVRVVQLCCLALGAGRLLAFQTTSLLAVYILFALIITALGVVNTILTADTSRVAPANEIGGLYGVLEAVQSGAGMVGPMLGGALAFVHPIHAPLAAVVGLYGLIFVLVTFGYEHYVLSSQQPAKITCKSIPEGKVVDARDRPPKDEAAMK